MASRAWAWLRANAAPLGVGTPVVGVLASYEWNATETHRMAHKIRRGYFQPKAPADYDHRFCLFDRYMMEKASMVGLVGLKSTGKSSTLSHFLREKPNPFYLKLTDGNVYDAMYGQMKDSVLCLPFFAHHLRWDASKTSEKIVIEIFKLVREQTGSPVRGLTKGRPSSEDCAECAVGNGKLSPNFHRNPRPPARQGCEVALC